MKVVDTTLEGVKKIILEPFVDHRGEYIEIYNKQRYGGKLGYLVDFNNFVQDDISVSTKNVFRGIHGDNRTWKLISCLSGTFYLVVVNCNKEDNKFGFWEGFMMSEEIGRASCRERV